MFRNIFVERCHVENPWVDRGPNRFGYVKPTVHRRGNDPQCQ